MGTPVPLGTVSWTVCLILLSCIRFIPLEVPLGTIGRTVCQILLSRIRLIPLKVPLGTIGRTVCLILLSRIQLFPLEPGQCWCDSFLTTEGGSLLNNASNSTLGEGTLLRV